MNPRVPEEVVRRMVELANEGWTAKDIAKHVGRSHSITLIYLKDNGVKLAHSKGRKIECTQEYVDLALKMLDDGWNWWDIEEKIGFARSTMQRQIRMLKHV